MSAGSMSLTEYMERSLLTFVPSLYFFDIFCVCKEDKDLEQSVLCNLNLYFGCVWSAEFRVHVDIDGFSPACETEPGAAKREKVCLEISSEVAAAWDVIEAINTAVESGGDVNRISDDAECLRHS
jgi:hypothetical protein